MKFKIQFLIVLATTIVLNSEDKKHSHQFRKFCWTLVLPLLHLNSNFQMTHVWGFCASAEAASFDCITCPPQLRLSRYSPNIILLSEIFPNPIPHPDKTGHFPIWVPSALYADLHPSAPNAPCHLLFIRYCDSTVSLGVEAGTQSYPSLYSQHLN